MPHFVQSVLVIVAIIHLMPLAGVLGPARLTALYAVAVPEPNLELLLRHRAVLFGIIAALLCAGALHAPLRATALIVGLASVGSFLVLAVMVGPVNAALQRVVVADLLALALLLVAGVVQLRAGRIG